MQSLHLTDKIVLITGAAKRVGAVIARKLHAQGANLALHYHQSIAEAQVLQAELQAQRPHSVLLVPANLLNFSQLPFLVEQVIAHYGRLDALINNASTYYPTPLGQVTESNWEDLLGTNLKAPFFLSQAAAPFLKLTQGCIINLADIHGERPLKSHSVYSIAKAGLIMLTKALALELAPEVRVNAIAPGAILWSPMNENHEQIQQQIISRIALQRHGYPDDIAQAILFLLSHADYITGQVIAVDGGRSLNQ